MLPVTSVAMLAVIVAVIALLLAAVVLHPLVAAVVATIPPVERTAMNGTLTAPTATTTAATVILTAVTVTTIDVIATVLAAPMTANVMARMTGKDAMMIASVVRRTVRTAPTVRTGKVSCRGIQPIKRSFHSHTAVPLDPMPSAHDELDTAE